MNVDILIQLGEVSEQTKCRVGGVIETSHGILGFHD